MNSTSAPPTRKDLTFSPEYYVGLCGDEAKDFHVRELADQIADQVALIETVKENGLPVKEHEEFLAQLIEERELWSKEVSQ